VIENQAVAPDCPLRHTARITLVLSNLCPYKHMHPQCPASRAEEPQILPRPVAEDVISTAAEWGWGKTGTLAFHMYNEPTADPRLFSFLGFAKVYMPDCAIHIWTNGWYLNSGMLDEYARAGVTKLVVSTYSQAEYRRLRPLAGHLGRLRCKVWKRPLDDRLVTLNGQPPRRRRCHAPLYDLTIYPTGKIGLCCMDWAQRETFGDLTETPFAEAMTAAFPVMVEAERSLEQRRRVLGACLECRMRRGMFGYRAERPLDKVSPDCDTGGVG